MLKTPAELKKVPELPKSSEELIKATSWWEGFLHGRNEGYRVGLELGVRTAINYLEGMVEQTKQGESAKKINV